MKTSTTLSRPRTHGDRDDFSTTVLSSQTCGPPLPARGPPDDDTTDAFTIPQFCQRHQLSTPLYYKLRKLRLTPDEIRLGSKVLISRESAQRWRSEREAASKRTPEPVT